MSVEQSPSKASRSLSVIESVDDFESQVSFCYASFYKLHYYLLRFYFKMLFVLGYSAKTCRYFYRGV